MPDRLLRRLQRSAVVLVTGVLVGGLTGVVFALPAAADDPVFTISDQRIESPTGIATDTATSSYWMVDQTGAQMFALSRTGQVKGVVDFRASPVHVEAAAYRSGRLYVGDIGDPDRNRAFVSVYLFPNLTEDSGTVTYQRWDFAYPDGAHDAKAMVVNGSGRVYLITSGDDPGIYAAPAQPTRQGVNALARVGDAPAGVTDAVLLGDRWAVRTAGAVTELDPATFKKTASATLPVSSGDVLGVVLGGSTATGLVAASAGASAKVYAVPPPSTAGPASTPSAGKTGTPQASASSAGATDQEPAADSAADSSRSGTILAIVVAALVAIVAGVIVFLVPARRGGVRPVRPAAPARASTLPAAERPVAWDGQDQVVMSSPPSTQPGPPPVWSPTQASYGAARASVEEDRHRHPGDIEDDDPFDDTIVRADQLPGRRAEAVAPVAPSQPPRRSLGYDPDLWGEETLRRPPGDPYPDPDQRD